MTGVPGLTQILFSDANTILHRVAVNSTTGGVECDSPGVNLPVYSSVKTAALLISVKSLCYPWNNMTTSEPNYKEVGTASVV